MGGALKAIESGYMQNEIQDSAYRYQKAVENCEQVVVGVNAFKTEETIQLDRLVVNPAIEQNQRARLEKLRSERDAVTASELMGRLESAAKSSENLMPLIIECVEKDLTLGEICGVLRKTWGEYQAPAWA
jgi:methylmalonyl-CoA mutase N-terminal domain/subunit